MAGTDAERLRELRKRLLALALVLPPEYLRYLEGDLPQLEDGVVAADLFTGWDDGPEMTPGDVREELERLWVRLSRRESR